MLLRYRMRVYPGHDLVKAAIMEDIAVVTVPGASAGISALIASGLAPQPHIFYGFLPRKSGQQKQFFELKKDYPETQIFYESPHRVADTLENMIEVYGDRSVVLVRELTKIYEEYQRGKISDLLESISETPLKGECLLIVEGASQEYKLVSSKELRKITPLRKLQRYISGTKASFTQSTTNGKIINLMTKQGSLPSSLFLLY